MIGFVQSLSDNNNNPLTVDSCVDILTLGYTAKVTGCDESKKEIYVLVIPDAKPIAKNGQNINCSAEIQKIIADIIAAGILTEAECKERLSYMLTDENYADIAKWKAAIAHSQAPIKNILIEAVKDETKDVLTDAYFTAANKFYIAVSTEYKNGAVSDASMNIRGIIRALDEVASVNVGGTIFKPMTTLKQALKTCVIDVDEENADNQNLLRILDSISL